MWVQSILLFRNHYYTPVPAFVLNNIQKIPGHQSRVTYKKFFHQQFSVTYKKYLVVSQGIVLPLFSKDAVWVESILLCRKHYYSPVPAFVLNNIQKIPGHQLRVTYKKYLQQFSVTYKKIPGHESKASSHCFQRTRCGSSQSSYVGTTTIHLFPPLFSKE